MDDLISRQAAIDAIRASASKYTGFMGMEMYTDDDAVEAINGVPSAQPAPRWIPCSERLPEEHVEVLVTTKRGHLFIAENSSLFGGWLTEGGFLGDFEVLAWQPLPEPYKEEKANE